MRTVHAAHLALGMTHDPAAGRATEIPGARAPGPAFESKRHGASLPAPRPGLALFGGDPVMPAHRPLAKMFREVPLAERFAEYVGARHALPTSSGTTALISSLIGAGVEPGDEVITVSFSWYSTATSILQVGAVPSFVDIEPDAFGMDPARIEERITPRTRAILAASLYGHPADYEGILAVARKHGLVVIDDACQSVGACLGGQALGVVADLTAFSFSGKPIVSTSGGMVTTDSTVYYERAMLAGQHPSFIATHARNPDVWRFASTAGYGGQVRLDGRSAERAYEQLERLESANTCRRANAQALTRRLREIPGIRPPIEREGARHVYHMYTGLFDGSSHGITRDEFVEALNAEGVPTLAYVSSVNFLRTPDGTPHAAGPLHRRALFQDLSRTGRAGPFRLPDGVCPDYPSLVLPVTERCVAEEFNIPQRALGSPFTESTMQGYADAIEKVLSHARDIIAARGSDRPRHVPFLMAHESDS